MGTFKKDKDSTGAVTLTRKGSDYDTGRDAGDASNASAMKAEIDRGMNGSEAAKNSKRYAKSSKNLLGTDAPFFKHTIKDNK